MPRTNLYKCSLEELETLKSVSIKTYQQHYSYLWIDQGASYMSQQFNPEALKRQILDINCDLFLVEKRDTVIGFVRLNYNSKILSYPPESCLEIQRIYLLQEFTGQGIGAEIFGSIEKIACDRSYGILWLMAMDSSPARTFYEKHGYQVKNKKEFSHPYIKPQLKGMYLMVKHLR